MKTKTALLIFFFLLIIPAKSMAQSGVNQTNPNPVTKTEQQQVIDSISVLLNKNYVFPDVAKKMSDLISSNLKNGSYASDRKSVV